MNLNTLFPEQKKLDEHILNEKGLHGQDLLKKKTVALICELYECVNEARFFKFWSSDQKPRNYCMACEIPEVELHSCHNPLLEEYADVIHFTISIANDLGYTEHTYKDMDTVDLNDLTIGLTNLITLLPESRSHGQMSLVLNYVIKLGYQLGFTEEDVINAYYSKNEENHARQANGY